jgi:hypothetical protein
MLVIIYDVDHDLCFAQTGQWLKSSSAMQNMECMGTKKDYVHHY